ncbi:MAG: ankyrin repeat domain-containing protein [Phocaeicola vulgatus]|nr:MAG: ankyrin repeat domain-containing protein [Phocaeicola vulgatus]
MNNLKEQISELFDDEINWANINIDKIKEVYKEKVALKNERESEFRKVRSEDNDEDYITKELRDVLVEGYEEVLKIADNIAHASLESLNEFSNFLDEMVSWDNSEHECWVNTLRPKIDSALNRYKLCCDRHNSAIEYSYYNKDYRKDLSKRIQNNIANRFKEFYDSMCEECKSLLEEKTRLEAIIKNMQGYQNLFMGALDMGIRLYKQQNKATTFYKDDDFIPNVFESIQKDNYKHFLLSFEQGVDLSVCNTDGYNPLTFAVQAGNNQMVQFLLDHNADPSLKDRRGYNAFHTAVENQYRDICKLLLEVDPDLISTETDSGESAKELAQKATFAKWIEQEINYA